MPKLNLNDLSHSTVEHYAEVFCALAESGDLDLLLRMGFEQDEQDPSLFYMASDEFYFMVDTYKKTSLAAEIEAYNPHPQHDTAMDNWRCEFSWR